MKTNLEFEIRFKCGLVINKFITPLACTFIN